VIVGCRRQRPDAEYGNRCRAARVHLDCVADSVDRIPL